MLNPAEVIKILVSESVLAIGEKIIVSDEFKKGDRVQWESSQGTIEGIVNKKLTEPTDIKGL